MLEKYALWLILVWQKTHLIDFLTIKCYIYAVYIYWRSIKMKIKSKWLLVGSLMCIGVGSVFQSSYGMSNDEEMIDEIKLDNFRQLVLVDKEEKELFLSDDLLLNIMTYLTPREIVNFGETCKQINLISNEGYLWKQKAIKCNLSKTETQKINNNIFRSKDIVIGHELWDKFDRIRFQGSVANEKRLEFLMQAAENGCEEAIYCFLHAHKDGSYGLKANNAEGLELSQKYADERSENAIDHLLDAYRFG